jgi:Sulfotransferase family
MGIRGLLREQKAARKLDALEERLMWITCSPRSGSTWLLNLFSLHPEVTMINEPLIGSHLGLWTEDILAAPLGESDWEKHVWHRYRADHQEYFFATSFRDSWAPPLRTLLLARFAAHIERFGRPPPGGQAPFGCVKEPLGGQSADFVAGVLPRARMLHLVRDPRDVLASILDAYSDESWFDKGFPGLNFSAVGRNERVRTQALRWRVRAEAANAALAAHDPARAMRLRYEDLRAEPVHWLETIFKWAGLPEVDAEEFVARMEFGRDPAGTGEGRFQRKGKPGSWDESLTPDEVGVIEGECGKLMAEFGYQPTVAQQGASAG